MSDQLPFSSRQVANMLAVRAVKHASEFLGGKFGLTLLGMHAEQLQLDLLLSDPLANGLLNPVRLLNLAMLSTSRLASEVTAGEIESVARLDRWMHVIAALAELVQQERARFSREHGAAA